LTSPAAEEQIALVRLAGLRPLDWAAAALSLAAFVLAIVLTAAGSAGEPVVVIEGQSASWAYPLNADVEVDVPGPLGVTHVQIHGGSAWVSDSPCTNKICISMGHIGRVGAWVACLPNRVFVNVEGRQGGEVDKVAF
jgi:hypothetical protein